MFSKNTKLLIISLIVIIIILSVLLFLRKQTANTREVIQPIPIFENKSPAPSPFTQVQTTEDTALRQQTEADINFINLQNQTLKQYPWYNDFPLQKNNIYFVLFDLNKNEFRAKIYPKNNSDTPVEEQINSYKQEILGRMKKAGVDTDSVKIEWFIYPQ